MTSTLDATLESHFETYRVHKLNQARGATVYQYRLNIRRFEKFLGRPPLVTDLRDEVVSDATGWIQRELRLSAASASKFRDNILALWRWMARKQIVGHWPDVPEVREPKRVPLAWTKEQLAALWRYLERMPGTIDGIAACDWFCSLHAVLWDAGERIGATLQTEWPAVDLQGGWIVIKAETRKGGFADKLSRLHPSTVELLERIRFPERRLVWPWPFNRYYLWRVYGDVLKRAAERSQAEVPLHPQIGGVAHYRAVELGGGAGGTRPRDAAADGIGVCRSADRQADGSGGHPVSAGGRVNVLVTTPDWRVETVSP